MKCDDCKFSHDPGYNQDMVCRFNAPRAGVEFHYRFPAVSRTDWCRRHEPRDGTTQQRMSELEINNLLRKHMAEQERVSRAAKYGAEAQSLLLSGYDEAVRIATYIIRTHFPECQEWRPLDTLSGVLGQIDNMVQKWKADIIDFEKERSR